MNLNGKAVTAYLLAASFGDRRGYGILSIQPRLFGIVGEDDEVVQDLGQESLTEMEECDHGKSG
jgi:hypothetical protein